MQFATAQSAIAPVAEILRPSRRMKPEDAARKYLRDKEGRPWSADAAPYMLEPLNLLASRRYQGIVFVGPARTSKTFTLIFGGLAYIATCNPGDTTVVQMSKDTARNFSREEFDPIFRHSEELGKRLSQRARDDNTFDKFFKSGMVVNFGWPAVSQLSGKTRKFMFVTDYDRPENRDNVDGEGILYDLAAKRVETYMSQGKCLAESSPGEDWVDPQWTAKVEHEAPPALGILSLHNRGTMARWYWPCRECGEFSQALPGPAQFDLPDFEELEEIAKSSDLLSVAAEYAKVVCKKCGGIHRMEHRPAMNLAGRWVHSGESIDAQGVITGDRIGTRIASYWLGGAAAAYQRWDSMVLGYLQAVAAYTRTGDENGIRAKTNTDFAAPYMPRAAAKRRKAEDLIAKAEDFPRAVVPAKVRFLTAAVDVQANRFVCSIYGWGEGLERWLLDRYSIAQSPTRFEGSRPAALDPMAYPEDWDAIVDQVVLRKLPLAENERLFMEPVLTLVDSGGRAVKDGPSTTQRAYEFWRRARDAGYGQKVMLLKGLSSPTAARVTQSWPDASNRGDRHSGAVGDVPVWMVNTLVFKDALFGDLSRVEPGPGFIHLPKWAEASVFAELVAEVRTKKGWEKPPGVRNEEADLAIYNRVACFVLGAEQLNWSDPPEWARRPVTHPEQQQPSRRPQDEQVEWRRGSYLNR